MAAVDPRSQAAHTRAIQRRGVPVTFQRLSGVAPNVTITPATGATVTAVVYDYAPDGSASSQAGYGAGEIGAITQGERKILVMASDLAGAGFPLPVQKNDRALVLDSASGVMVEMLTVTRVDANKRAIAGAIELEAAGVQ